MRSSDVVWEGVFLRVHTVEKIIAIRNIAVTESKPVVLRLIYCDGTHSAMKHFCEALERKAYVFKLATFFYNTRCRKSN
jgi:hypothetical protein